MNISNKDDYNYCNGLNGNDYGVLNSLMRKIKNNVI